MVVTPMMYVKIVRNCSMLINQFYKYILAGVLASFHNFPTWPIFSFSSQIHRYVIVMQRNLPRQSLSSNSNNPLQAELLMGEDWGNPLLHPRPTLLPIENEMQERPKVKFDVTF